MESVKNFINSSSIYIPLIIKKDTMYNPLVIMQYDVTLQL